jgi:3-dehydroquinate dehydratase type I
MRTKVCVSVVGKNIQHMIDKAEEALEHGADLVEFRFDMLDTLSEYELRNVRKIESFSIAKVREREDLHKLTKALSPAYIDIPLKIAESSSLNDMKCKGLIVSWHDYRKTPATDELMKIAEKASKFGLPKVVTKANVFEDNLKVLSLYKSFKGSLIAFCMGEKGVTSRYLSVCLGAPILYSCIHGEQVAEGQPELETALSIRELLK